MNEYLDISPEVAEALHERRPVVALESTIISHGFPFPENLETAQTCERIARDHGAVPATIAMLGGRLKVGLAPDELEYLATTPGIPKASRRDLGILVASGSDGATTVAGTMVVAAMAGVRVFATGGIGGVHRGAQDTMDVSADLLELAQTDVAVVSAGAKSILDLPLTLEVLETHGVPVLGYQTSEFPAFYLRSSGLPVDARLDTPEAIAEVLRARRSMELHGGVVIANPIPEADAIDPETVAAWIATALADAEAAGVHGKATTPFLLSRLYELSEGATAIANKALVYNNVRLAAEVASAL